MVEGMVGGEDAVSNALAQREGALAVFLSSSSLPLCAQ